MESAAVTVRIAATVSRGDLMERTALTERVVLTEKTVVRQAKEDRHADLVRIHVRDSNPAVRAAHLATERGRKLQARDRRDPARAVSTRIPTKESRE